MAILRYVARGGSAKIVHDDIDAGQLPDALSGLLDVGDVLALASRAGKDPFLLARRLVERRQNADRLLRQGHAAEDFLEWIPPAGKFDAGVFSLSLHHMVAYPLGRMAQEDHAEAISSMLGS